MAEDALTLDITRDLERIDGAMTRIILHDELSAEFLRDPNGTMIKVGMHPPTPSDVNERTNRVFYAAITNKELTNVVQAHFRDFKPKKLSRYRKVHDEGLSIPPRRANP